MAVCITCEVSLQQSKTTIEKKFNDVSYTINDVPVTVCPKCGESYVDNSVLKKIEKVINENPSAKVHYYRA
jgi:YgiT-type zinc finger domain-containing protein